MPRVDDVTLLAILVREALRKAGAPLSIDHVTLKAGLEATLAESEARVFIQSTRTTPEPLGRLAIFDHPHCPECGNDVLHTAGCSRA